MIAFFQITVMDLNIVNPWMSQILQHLCNPNQIGSLINFLLESPNYKPLKMYLFSRPSDNELGEFWSGGGYKRGEGCRRRPKL